MPKSSGDLALELELEYAPEDYNNLEDLLDQIRMDYDERVVQLAPFDAEDERFIDNQEVNSS